MGLLVKHIDHSEVYDLVDMVAYEKGRVSGLILAQQPSVGITLFAIDEGEGLNTHFVRRRAPCPGGTETV